MDAKQNHKFGGIDDIYWHFQSGAPSRAPKIPFDGNQMTNPKSSARFFNVLWIEDARNGRIKLPHHKVAMMLMILDSPSRST